MQEKIEKRSISGQISQELSSEAQEKREKSNTQERERREKEGVDWILLGSVAELIKRYLNTKSKDEYASDILVDGNVVLYETDKDNLPEELMVAKEKGVLDLIIDDGVWKFALSEKTQKNYENYIKIKESWGKEKEQIAEQD